MANQTDFNLAKYADGTLTVTLAPQVNISGNNIRFQAMKRFGGISGLITRTAASGFNNVSGINVTNGAAGVFNVTINGSDTSGMDFSNYAYSVEKLDSGSRTILVQGYLVVQPTGGV